MTVEWLKVGIAPLKDLLDFLYKKSQTNDVQKKQLIMELRNNLNVFKNGLINEVPYDTMIDLLNNEAIQLAIRGNFKFTSLKAGQVETFHVEDDRNKRYTGWTAEKLVEKIDEKIVELKNIKKMNNNTVVACKNNIALIMGNLYFRMKLLAEFIRGDGELESKVEEDTD